jgi:hypothetical protein
MGRIAAGVLFPALAMTIAFSACGSSPPGGAGPADPADSGNSAADGPTADAYSSNDSGIGNFGDSSATDAPSDGPGADQSATDSGSTHDSGDGATLGCLAPPTGMVGWWGGDGDATDATGAHDLTWCGYSGEDGDDTCLNVTPTYVPGKVGQAFAFDMTNYVRSLDFSISGTPFTVDLWVQWSSKNEPEWSTIFAAAETDDLDTTFQIDSDGAGGSRVQAGNDVIHTPFGAVTTTTFQHLAMVFDGSNVATYLNGVAVASDSWSLDLTIDSLKLGMNRTYNRPLSGAVDEVHVFGRALMATEIGAVYAAGSAGLCH